MLNAFIEIAADILLELVLSGFAILFAWVGSKIGTNKKLSNINAAKAEVENAVTQTVLELQQTVVDGLKAAAVDGKLSENEIATLGVDLWDKVLHKLSEPSINILRAAGVDLEAYIHGAAEGVILKLKNN